MGGKDKIHQDDRIDEVEAVILHRAENIPTFLSYQKQQTLREEKLHSMLSLHFLPL